jgi:alkyldihydroxyacetonephosphate synthase
MAAPLGKPLPDQEYVPTADQARALDRIKEIVGAKGWTTDPAEMAPALEDWRGLFRGRAQMLVRPASTDEVSRVLAECHTARLPVVPQGGNTGMVGGSVPFEEGEEIVLSLARMNRIREVDPADGTMRVEAGCVLATLQQAASDADRYFPLSLGAEGSCMIGGNLSTNAGGTNVLRYGNARDQVLGLEVVLPDGRVLDLMTSLRKDNTGYDLKHLFIGAEGTLGVVTEVTLKIFPHDVHQILEAVRFDAVEPGLDVMRLIMRRGLRPFLVRYYDQEEARHAMVDPEFTGCAMFLGFEGVETVAHAEYAEAMKICRAAGGRPVGPEPVLGWLERRFDFSTVENIVNSPSGVAETIEVANFWSGIHDTYIQLKTALAPYADEVLGHFSHVYEQGTSLYIILLRKPEEGKNAAGAERMLSEIWDIANRIALDTGAAVAHHHGAGLARLPVIREALGSSMTLLEALKQALDPEATLCPGKLGLGQG